MTDTEWAELRRALARAIMTHDARVGETAAEYAELIREAIRQGGMTLTGEAQQYITDYLDAADGLIRDGIGAAVEPYAAAGAAAGLGSDFVQQRVTDAYQRRWPDGLRLSKRVWQWQEETRRGVSEALAAGVRTNRTTGSVVMDMQRAIEAASGERFTIEARLAEDWADRLRQAARGSIRDPRGMTLWAEAVAQARTAVDGLRDGGTRRQAEHTLTAIREAVAKGRLDLVDRHLQWWLYDRQLYRLRRIARTEMATAGHRAVLAIGDADPDVTGYQWRLSASHPVEDICDYYANVDFGMGAGVWPKDRVPEGKAHPHCVLGGTLVRSPGAIVAATQARYEGRVIEITTCGARRLSCTPNHAILTDQGWVQAQLLRQGQQVVTAAGGEFASVQPDDHDMPPSIEEIFHALLESGGMASALVPAAAEHFHGDGRAMDGDVHVVHVDGLLLSDGESGGAEHLSQFGLGGRDVVQAALLRERVAHAAGDALRAPSNGGMGSSRDALAILRGGPAHAQRLTLGHASDADAALTQPQSDDASGDAGLGSQTLDGFAGLVSLDEIIEIRDVEFSGHVYDLQVEPHQWYSANSIVAHNCMCSISPTTRRMRRDGKRGATSPGEFFEQLSPTQREAVAPRWAKDLHEAGVPWERLLRADGQWLGSRAEVRERMGSERYDAASAVGSALREPRWATQDLSLTGGKWRRSEAALAPYAEVSEVGEFLARVRATNGVGTDARELHYLLRRYANGEPLTSVADLDGYLSAVLADPQATVEPHGPRYRVYSERLRRVAIIESNGRRVSAFPRDDALILLEAPWTIADLTT